MPSPIGHALAGIAAGWLVVPPRGHASRVVTLSALCAAAAVAPDLDLLFGAHSGPTHGLGAAVLAGAIVWAVSRRTGKALGAGVSAAWVAVAATLAYASHTLLDWLGSDTSSPIGIMALWPFDRGYYESPLHVFGAISRRYWLPEFWTSNVAAIARELVILVPLVALVFVVRRRR